MRIWSSGVGDVVGGDWMGGERWREREVGKVLWVRSPKVIITSKRSCPWYGLVFFIYLYIIYNTLLSGLVARRL